MGKHLKKYNVTIRIWAWDFDDAIRRAQVIANVGDIAKRKLLSVKSDHGEEYPEETWENDIK